MYVHHSVVHHSVMHHSVMHHRVMHHSVVHHSVVQRTTVWLIFTSYFLQKNLMMNGYDVEKDFATFAILCVISSYPPNPRGPRGLFFAKARAFLAKET
jgi:hypothetical protein